MASEPDRLVEPDKVGHVAVHHEGDQVEALAFSQPDTILQESPAYASMAIFRDHGEGVEVIFPRSGLLLGVGASQW